MYSVASLRQLLLFFDSQDDFDVDRFVSDCRKRVQLEELREDLELYYRLLKTAMVELINQDYADFVNLSTNLVTRAAPPRRFPACRAVGRLEGIARLAPRWKQRASLAHVFARSGLFQLDCF